MDQLAFLADVISRHAHNRHLRTEIDGLTISATDRPTDPRPGVSEPSLAVVVQGSKRTVLGDGIFDYASGEFLVVSLDLPLIGRVTQASPDRPFLGFSVRLDPPEIAALLLETPVPHQGDTGGAASIAVAHAEQDLLGAAGRLVGLLDAPADVAVLAPLYRREILWRLLACPARGLVRQIGLADGNLAHIARTVRWIRDHYRDPIRIEQLAGLAGMSPSAFHRHFRSVTHLTPIQYQKAIRLQEARLALLAGQGDVAEIAHAVGYDSPSQFSREYRRLFGVPPGRDGVRLRTAALEPVAPP
jgi:AraC-like DNA-binding protein